MASSSSSSNPHVSLEVREEYPYTYPYAYPSHVCYPSFITFKLNDRDEYNLWKAQMLCLLKSHGMLGFIHGTHVSPRTSFSGKEKVDDLENHRRQWREADALVKGWILGSLSKRTLRFVFDRVSIKNCSQEEKTTDFSAKDVWDELTSIYSPDEKKEKTKEEEELAKLVEQEPRQDLYKATLAGRWSEIKNTAGPDDTLHVTDKITKNGDTALHVAVSTAKSPDFLEKLLGLTPKDTKLLELKNSDGSTLLHVAANVGNTKAAEILVEKYAEMLLVEDKKNQTPLAIALSNMHTETSQLLLKHFKEDASTQEDILFSGPSRDKLLAAIISSKDFRLANKLAAGFYSKLHSDAVLMALAKNFPREPTTLEKYTDFSVEKTKTYVERHLNNATNKMHSDCVHDTWLEELSARFFRAILRIILWIPQMLVWPFVKDRARIHDDAVELLKRVCDLMKKTDGISHGQCFTNSIIEATRNNANTVVHIIIEFYPDAISSANEDGHNIMQCAVISRSEKVYNSFYDMGLNRNLYRATKDAYGNNLLHLAARLAPINKLNLISGAALQIQRELQWYKEIEGFVSPLSSTETNAFNETPKMIFTREHKDLLVEGEKWMKATAKSFTIAAALITTIVFAAAITVPGGNRQDKGGENQHTEGLPVFTKKTAFSVFAISDAISLFAAVTSLLMFLSVLTTRYAEQDFLLNLPLKLIIGSASLFISTTAMVIAFGATVYLVFGQSKLTVLIVTLFVLICLQISVFVILQFRLVIDLVHVTYGRSIFRRIRD